MDVPVPAAGHVIVLQSDSDIDDDDEEEAVDSDNNDDGTARSVYSVASNASEQPHEFSDENSNTDRASSVDIYESRTPSPMSADVAMLPVEQTATSVVDSDSVTMQTETGSAVSSSVTQPVLDLDDSLSCFKTTRPKKPVISAPVINSDDDVSSDAEVSV